MEKEENDILLKIRSSQACIRDGYKYYSANFRRIFRHTWPVALVFAVFSAVASALPVLVSPSLVLAGGVLATVAVILLLFVVNKLLHKHAILTDNGKVAFAGWMRHCGKVFLVSIVCLFIIAMLTLFTSLPTIIMMAANWESQIGMINGDPTGMPAYVKWLSIVAFLIAGFLQAYVWLSAICPLYLTRTSIALQEKERQEFNQKTNTKNYEEAAIVYRP